MNKKLLVTVTVILFVTELSLAQSEFDRPVQQVETVEAPDRKNFSSMEEYSKAKEAWALKHNPTTPDPHAINLEQITEPENQKDSNPLPTDRKDPPKQ
jgi:uncharacterized protein (DUF1684 family)